MEFLMWNTVPRVSVALLSKNKLTAYRDPVYFPRGPTDRSLFYPEKLETKRTAVLFGKLNLKHLIEGVPLKSPQSFHLETSVSPHR